MLLSFSSDGDPLYGCLASQHGLGHVGMARLLGVFGSASGVYGADPVAWRAAHPSMSDAMAASLAAGPDERAWERLRERCAALGITIAAPGWERYPRVFEALEAPPPLVYLRGAWREEDARAVALVGTRTPTAYGREAARRFARDFAAAGHTVVSGLALGVDAVAHQGALDAGGRTLAVIGCGLDLDYPAENRAVRTAIEERGAVISEFPPGTPARPAHFPRRNRLISALSRAVVVVEAGEASGALLTADHARAQGRLLFAVPGPIFSGASTGTNALLRDGARLASCAGDVLATLAAPSPESESELGSESAPPVRPRRRARKAAPREAKGVGRRPASPAAPALPLDSSPDRSGDPVLALWEADEACPLDTLAARAEAQGLWSDGPAGRAAAALLERLLVLELRGLVRRAPGGVYRKAEGR